jgi:hypothetical protein
MAWTTMGDLAEIGKPAHPPRPQPCLRFEEPASFSLDVAINVDAMTEATDEIANCPRRRAHHATAFCS